MNDEQDKEEPIVDEKDKLKEAPKEPSPRIYSVGGFIGGVGGYIFTKTVMSGEGMFEHVIFIGLMAIYGCLVADWFWHIWTRFLRRFLRRFYERYLRRFYE